MVFRRFNINIIIRLLLLALICILGTLYFINSGFDIYFISLTAIAIFLVLNLIRYFNRSNHDLSLFLSSIINEDSSLVFNEDTGNKSYNSLHKSINRLNDLIREARMNIIIQ